MQALSNVVDYFAKTADSRLHDDCLEMYAPDCQDKLDRNWQNETWGKSETLPNGLKEYFNLTQSVPVANNYNAYSIGACSFSIVLTTFASTNFGENKLLISWFVRYYVWRSNNF